MTEQRKRTYIEKSCIPCRNLFSQVELGERLLHVAKVNLSMVSVPTVRELDLHVPKPFDPGAEKRLPACMLHSISSFKLHVRFQEKGHLNTVPKVTRASSSPKAFSVEAYRRPVVDAAIRLWVDRSEPIIARDQAATVVVDRLNTHAGSEVAR